LHTTIAVEADEFDEIEVEDRLHIIISVKDFRAILQHAGVTSSGNELSAAYSNPGRPMKLSYTGDGILCEFILMTVGEKNANGDSTKAVAKKGMRGKTLGNNTRHGLEATSGASTRAPSVATEAGQAAQDAGAAPTAAKPSTQKHPLFEMRPPPIPPTTLRSDSLFVAQDDDNQWEPVNPDDEDDEMENARLEWDASNQPVSCDSLI